LLAKILVIPFAIAFTVAALACLAFSLNILLWPILSPASDDEPPGAFVILVLTAITALPGVAFAGIAATLWLFVLGKNLGSRSRASGDSHRR
jgi:predicted benzoate:H+ symporter BenE